jgi:hypothetical protein
MRLPTLLALLLLALALPLEAAGGSASYGEYRLFYNAIPSGMLHPQMAQRYGIQRSRGRGLITISLQHRNQPVHGIVRVNAQDAQGRDVPVELRRMQSAGAVSYLGTFPIEPGQTLRFQIEALPEGGSDMLRAAFSQAFFSE